MPARKHETNQERFINRQDVEKLDPAATLSDLLVVAAAAIAKGSGNSIIYKHGISWSEYKPEIRDGVGYVVRETCERCGKVHLPPGQRRLRKISTDIGPIYLDTGICKDCINASIYVDKYLDGDPLSETEAKKLFYKYAEQYEKQWRITLATAPRIAMTQKEWQHRCNFFGGCALCGGYIEVQHKYFPTELNGFYTSWNIIPLCKTCADKYKRIGIRKTPEKAPRLYHVFSTNTYFQRTKTIRLYLLAQMELHGIWMDNLEEYRKRFLETKVLKYSLPVGNLSDAVVEAVLQLARSTSATLSYTIDAAQHLALAGYDDDKIIDALQSVASLEAHYLLATSIIAHGGQT